MSFCEIDWSVLTSNAEGWLTPVPVIKAIYPLLVLHDSVRFGLLQKRPEFGIVDGRFVQVRQFSSGSLAVLACRSAHSRSRCPRRRDSTSHRLTLSFLDSLLTRLLSDFRAAVFLAHLVPCFRNRGQPMAVSEIVLGGEIKEFLASGLLLALAEVNGLELRVPTVFDADGSDVGDGINGLFQIGLEAFEFLVALREFGLDGREPRVGERVVTNLGRIRTSSLSRLFGSVIGGLRLLRELDYLCLPSLEVGFLSLDGLQSVRELRALCRVQCTERAERHFHFPDFYGCRVGVILGVVEEFLEIVGHFLSCWRHVGRTLTRSRGAEIDRLLRFFCLPHDFPYIGRLLHFL